MNAEVNQSVYDQHLVSAVDAVLITPGAERLYGYATISGTRENPEIEAHVFPSWESMRLALSETFKGRLLNDLYHTVLRFTPDKPIRMYAVIEADDDEADQ